MIGTIDISLNTHNPNIPIKPVFTFASSPQSFRIGNVPRKVGRWDITNVFVNVSYPDNSTVAKECVLAGGVWVATVNGCPTSGKVENGLVVTANGTDENGQAVSNYVLGAGDVYVKQLDGAITPGSNVARMYFYETPPQKPNRGDVTFQEGAMVLWDGTEWKPCGEGGVAGEEVVLYDPQLCSTVATETTTALPSFHTVGNRISKLFAMDSVGNLYVRRTFEWSVDGVQRSPIHIDTSLDYNTGMDGTLALLSPRYTEQAFGQVGQYYLTLGFNVHEDGCPWPKVYHTNHPERVFYEDTTFSKQLEEFDVGFAVDGHAVRMKMSPKYTLAYSTQKFHNEVAKHYMRNYTSSLASLESTSYKLLDPYSDWIFEGCPVDNVYLRVEHDYSTSEWILERDMYGEIARVSGMDNNIEVVFEDVEIDGYVTRITAYRNQNADYILMDRAVNQIDYNGTRNDFTFPPARQGHAREFIISVNVTTPTYDQLNFLDDCGNTMVIHYNPNAGYPYLCEMGRFIITMREIALNEFYAQFVKVDCLQGA